MRKFTWIWTAILLSCLTLASCSNEDNPVNPETTPTTEENIYIDLDSYPFKLLHINFL